MEYYEFLLKKFQQGDEILDLDGDYHIVSEVLREDDHEEGAGILTEDGLYINHAWIDNYDFKEGKW